MCSIWRRLCGEVSEVEEDEGGKTEDEQEQAYFGERWVMVIE